MSRHPDQPLLSASDRRSFLTAVRYEQFYTNLNPLDLDEFALLQRLAETAAPRTLSKALRELTLSETVQLIYYVFKHYREGSYTILATLETLYAPDHALHTLIRGFRTYYYDLDQAVPLDLNRLLAFQEVYARKQTEICYHLFGRLILLIIESPVIIAQLTRSDPQQAEQHKQILQQRFKYQPSLTEFENFTRRFGLTHGLPFMWQGSRQPETSLRDKLQLLCTLFERPEALPDISAEEMSAFLSFVLNILLHIEAMHRQPDKYSDGLRKLACAIPTRGRNLASLPGLPSLLRGLQGALTSLRHFPIFIYDQAPPKTFAANQRYIAKLAAQYDCPILHLSLPQILSLAKKLNIEALLDTTKIGLLGFGGARNCVFLLTPILKQLFERGYSTVPAMLEAEPNLLKQLLQTHVLATPGHPGDTLFMVDDDMEIPPSNLFCHALFAQEAARRYTSSASYAIGRATKFNIIYPPLKRLLEEPKSLFASTQWSTNVCSAAMSEYITKPKICLNLPFGSEEQHLRGLMEANPLLHPSIHLAGPRYPVKTLPTRPWSGLEEYLAWYLPYSIHVAMTVSLLDPTDRNGRCVFPWNQKDRLQSFTNLRQAIQCIAAPELRQEMQNRFWHNLQLFCQAAQEDMFLLTAIQDLMHTDIENTLQSYQQQNSLTPAEKASLNNIGQIYSFYQKDALLFWGFANLVTRGTSVEEAKSSLEKQFSLRISDYPLTHGLDLLLHAVGLAEFNQLLDNLEKS